MSAITVNPTIIPPRSAPIFHAVDSDPNTSEVLARARNHSHVATEPAVVSTLWTIAQPGSIELPPSRMVKTRGMSGFGAPSRRDPRTNRVIVGAVQTPRDI